jgi:hypothetical protein
MELRLSIHHGIFKSTCTEMAGDDFFCRSGQMSCVAHSRAAARAMCKDNDSCIGWVTNQQGTMHTLKQEHIHPNEHCNALRNKLIATSICSKQMGRKWVRNKCSISDSCHAPVSETTSHTWRSDLPPILVTVQTNGAPPFLQQVVNHSFEYVNLAQVPGIPPYRSPLSKIDMLHRYLQSAHHRDDRLVIFLDGSDVEYGGCQDFQVRMAKHMQRGVLFSAEFGCGELNAPFPPGCVGLPGPSSMIIPATINKWAACDDGDMPASTSIPCSDGRHKYKFLNSGMFAGSRRSILNMLDTISGYNTSCFYNRAGQVGSDQTVYNRYFLDNPTSVTLDYTGDVFLTTFRLRHDAFARNTSMIVPHWSTQAACFVHHAGRGIW